MLKRSENAETWEYLVEVRGRGGITSCLTDWEERG